MVCPKGADFAFIVSACNHTRPMPAERTAIPVFPPLTPISSLLSALAHDNLETVYSLAHYAASSTHSSPFHTSLSQRRVWFRGNGNLRGQAGIDPNFQLAGEVSHLHVIILESWLPQHSRRHSNAIVPRAQLHHKLWRSARGIRALGRVTVTDGE